jgi:hypothetical protein
MMLSISDDELAVIVQDARAHADALQADIANAATRIEHIRLTSLAMQAAQIATVLEQLAAHADVPRASMLPDNGEQEFYFPTH